MINKIPCVPGEKKTARVSLSTYPSRKKKWRNEAKELGLSLASYIELIMSIKRIEVREI